MDKKNLVHFLETQNRFENNEENSPKHNYLYKK